MVTKAMPKKKDLDLKQARVDDVMFLKSVSDQKRIGQAIIAQIRRLEARARRPGVKLSERQGLSDEIANLRTRLVS